MINLANTGFGRALGRGLTRITGSPLPRFSWRLVEGPFFDNQIAILRYDGREAVLTLDKTVAGEQDEKTLDRSFKRTLT